MPLNGKLTKTETTALENSWLSFEGALGPNQLLYDLDELLLTRGNGQGLKLYDRLLDDPHCFAVMNKLAQAITSREWTVTPASDKRAEKKAADLVREQITWLNARDLHPNEENHSSITGLDSLTRAFVIGGVLNGRHFAEVMWAPRDSQTVAVEVRSRDPRQFAFAKGQHGYVLRHLTKDNMVSGTEVPLKKILAWSHGGLDGNPYGRALGRVLFWPVWFKKQGIRFWLKFVDRFAAPKPTGKYPRGATSGQIAELRAALAAISNETEIAIPEGMLIEYLEAAQSGTIDTYDSLCNYMDGQISRAVLGETGTTDQTGSGGSRARDQVGNEVRLEGAKSIADSLSATFNRLAAWITEFNYPGVEPPTIWRVFDDQEDLDQRIGRDKTLFDMGYRLNAETVASVYGEGYEEAVIDDEPALIASLGVPGVQAMTAILQQAAAGQLPKENAIAVLVSVFGIEQKKAAKMVPEPQEQPTQANPLDQLFGGQDDGNSNRNATGGADGGNNPVGAGAAFSEDASDRSLSDTSDQIADKVRPQIQDALAPWLTTIRNFVDQSTSLEEIRDGLIDLYPELDGAAFAEAMGQAIVLAELAGREEVLGEDEEGESADGESEFAEAIEAALSGTVDFAAKKKPGGTKPNCNPAKSHFCQKPGGKGSCVSLSKKCKYPPTGAEKEVADWAREKGGKTKKGKSVTDFPKDLTALKTIKSLGGSTGAILVEDPITGKRYVQKKGTSPEHLREEYAADKAYEALGARVPKGQLYETQNGPVKLAEYIEGKPLKSLSGKQKADAIAELKKGFAADALLGNWDVVGLDQDNILVDKTGAVYRIDNGGALRYRAQGTPKNDQWSDYPTELWSLRDPSINSQSAKAFSGLSHADIVSQIDQIATRKDALLSAVPEEAGLTISRRLGEMERTAKIGKTFAADNFTEEYTSEFSRHSMQLRQTGVFDGMSKQLQGSGYILEDEKGKKFDNIRGPGGVGDRVFDYINKNGGNHQHVADWKNAQSGSSYSSKSLTYKYFMASSRNDVDKVFWGEDQEEDKKKAGNFYKKYATNEYKTSMIAAHAAEYEMLSALDFPGKNKDGTVTVKRTISPVVVSKHKIKPGTTIEITQAAFDSTSLMNFVSVMGSFKTTANVPLHRILGTYFIPKIKGTNSSGFHGDGENEFVVMLNGIKFKAIGGKKPKKFTAKDLEIAELDD